MTKRPRNSRKRSVIRQSDPLPLKDEWIAIAKNKIAFLDERGDAAKLELKREIADLVLMKPDGLKALERGTGLMTDFAKAIKHSAIDHSRELNWWVTVYAAAAGATATFGRVLLIWADAPANQVGKAKVNAAIDFWFDLYARLVIK